MLDPKTPILIGAGQVTEKDPDLERASSPLDLMEQATDAALADAGIARDTLSDLDLLVVVRSFREPTRNSPEALAKRLGALKAKRYITPNGGNAPQYLVNRYAEAIARGEMKFCLFSGAEAMDTGRRIVKSGGKPDWSVPSDEDPELLFPDNPMSTDHERAHGIWAATTTYPLFENALRHHYGNSIPAHQREMGDLFARFSAVATRSPHAWFPIERASAEIATATPKNRYVGWPYTKFMNAMNQINQSATLLLTSVEYAKELGVDESHWLYLHGCADASERGTVSDRVNYHSSPAIGLIGKKALSMAGKTVSDIDFIDLYSCFPSAVEIARDELGIAKDDPRDLTITGGLPFHGGAGNNYVMNSIAAMADKLRDNPGTFGLVTANGGYLSKHAAGIYSTVPTRGPWQREDPDGYQPEIDKLPAPDFTEMPEGEAVIETWTVAFGRGGEPEQGIVIGRLGDGSDPMATRFIANTPTDPETLCTLTERDCVGLPGTVTREGELNIFVPHFE